MIMNLVQFALIVVSALGLIRCDFVHRPSNSEAVIGGLVELKCTTFSVNGNFSIEWQHVPVGETRPRIINKMNVITGACGDRCSIGGSQSGEYNLIIRELTFPDAGRYTCIDVLNSYTADAELIVFEAYPSPQSCTTVLPLDGAVGENSCGIEPDTVELSCNMSYRGNLKPVLEWTSDLKISGHKKIPAGDFVTNSVTVKPHQMRDSNYTCYVKYLDSALISRYSWSTSIRVFTNQTREVSITNCNSAQMVNCAVSTGHSCSYSWTNIVKGVSKKTYSGSMLNLNKLPNGMYICKAVCNVRGTSCAVEPVELDYCSGSKVSGLSPGAIAAIVISIVLCMIFVTILVLVIFLRRRLAGDNNNDGTQPQIEIPLIETRESKDPVPEGSDQTETPVDLTAGKPDILENICEKAEDQKPVDATSNGAQSENVTPPMTQQQSDSGSDFDLSTFVVVNVNPDSIEEKVEYRFPGK